MMSLGSFPPCLELRQWCHSLSTESSPHFLVKDKDLINPSPLFGGLTPRRSQGASLSCSPYNVQLCAWRVPSHAGGSERHFEAAQFSVLVLLQLNSSSCPDYSSTGKLVTVSDLNTCI